AKARPWDHAPARIEMRDLAFHVLQGQADSRVGFVRRGDAVEMVSRDQVFHALEARGAAFFSLLFVDADTPSRRAFSQPCPVEIAVAAGYYGMRAYLFVDDPPYHPRTDAGGRFHLPQVPAGACEVVCWLPSWDVERRERDPESGYVTRMVLGPHLETRR